MKYVSSAIAAMALCVAPGAAPGTNTDSVVYTVQFPEVSKSFLLFNGEYGQSNTAPIAGLPKFDPALGILVDVLISFQFHEFDTFPYFCMLFYQSY